MTQRPLIFITNDDGVNARGLRALVEVARRYGRVFAVAPEVTQSGRSHAITIYQPLYLRTVEESDEVKICALNGTPVDCVKMAFDHLLCDERPVLALSGINHGSNSAINILYSGTMGAAIEASFYGIPSIGLSLDDHDTEADLAGAVHYADRIIRQMLGQPLPTDLPLCLNVNIPVGAPEAIRGIRVCRQNRGYWRETFFCRQDPRGRDYFWLTGAFQNEEPEAEDTDEWALAHGFVSIVPIQVDLTNYRQIGELERVF